MTERKARKPKSWKATIRNGARYETTSAFLASWLCGLLAFAALAGCESAPRNYSAIRSYYDYDFTSAREALRDDARINNEQVILNNARLGMAALADGDMTEAGQAFDLVFEYLSTAGLNEDRTVAAVWTHEGVRIWKGEPFEQALMYHYVAAQFAVQGDWENARAAASNALFRLTDFGGDKTSEQLARKAARDDDYLDTGYTAVDTNFALGFLMQAIGSKLAGASGFDEQLNAALEIDESLLPITQRIRDGFDTLLIVDYGKGPTKIAYGRDDAFVRFDPQNRSVTPITVEADGQPLAKHDPVANINQMAVDHRWNNLEDVRRAKSVLGDALLVSGLVVASEGGEHDSIEAVLAGIGMAAAGLLSKSGAKADTRYLEFAPQTIYVVPLKLNESVDLRISIEGDSGAAMVLNDVQPGTVTQPRTFYLRLHGFDSPDPAWLTASAPIYGNDVTGVRDGDSPYILGGRDVSTPSRNVLAHYQSNGYLTDFTVNDLLDLYRKEGIFLGPGMDPTAARPGDASYRHILERGRALFTPWPHSMGYKRLMYQRHDEYEPHSETARNIADRIRVRENNNE